MRMRRNLAHLAEIVACRLLICLHIKMVICSCSARDINVGRVHIAALLRILSGGQDRVDGEGLIAAGTVPLTVSVGGLFPQLIV
jgi:hypothetical protein